MKDERDPGKGPAAATEDGPPEPPNWFRLAMIVGAAVAGMLFALAAE